MDGINSIYEGLAALGVDKTQAQRPRSFLFLQGPISDFYEQLGRALIARGHRVDRINLHLGDQLFWRLPATHYRGRFEGWRDFVGHFMDAHAVTDLLVHGDRRPHHLVAAEEARVRGIAVLATDLGYVRPDWVTLEYDGLTTYSRFPRDPEVIRALAEQFPPPDLHPRFRGPSFAHIAMLDIAYNAALVLGRPLYPHYRWHGIYHPFTEYAGWLWTLARQNATRRGTKAAKDALAAAPQSYFLFPLQLATDYQIRAHSPYRDGRDAVRQVITSYAASGTLLKLAIAIHPLDNGLIDWHRLAKGVAHKLGVAERVVVVDCGTPHEVLRNAAGVVTINSTSGLTALYENVPVKVLGHAIYDIPGLTHQGDLDDFWNAPCRPERSLLDAFIRALVGTTQVKGGYYEAKSKAHTVAAFAECLEQQPYPLQPLLPTELAARQAGKDGLSVAFVSAGSNLALATARTYAEPGAKLCLIGPVSEDLIRAAADCRHRGAIVHVCGDSLASDTFLAEFAAYAPIDLFFVDRGEEASVEPILNRLSCNVGRIAFIESGAAQGSPGAVFSRPVAPSDDRREQGHNGAAISVIRPARIAARLALRLNRPDLLCVQPERAALAIQRALARHQPVVALPGAFTAVVRTVRVLPAVLRDWVRGISASSVKSTVNDVDEARAVPQESGAGN